MVISLGGQDPPSFTEKSSPRKLHPSILFNQVSFSLCRLQGARAKPQPGRVRRTFGCALLGLR